MKFYAIGYLFFLLIACQGKKSPATAAPVKRDSATLPKVAANPYAPIDISPMDISYFPNDFPIAKMADPSVNPNVRIIYSRPHRQGRKIFGNLIKYGEPWRLGANEATEIEFFKTATIQGKTVSKGRYILYCIPQATEWTIVLNNNVLSWGLKFDPKKDVQRFQIPVQNNNPTIEFFTMAFEKGEKDTNLLIAWEDVIARLPIIFQ